MTLIFRRVLFYLIGTLITPKLIMELYEAMIGFARASAASTTTILDDVAVAAFERQIDKEALAKTLAVWLDSRIKESA